MRFIPSSLLEPNPGRQLSILRARNIVGISINLVSKQLGAVRACLPRGCQGGQGSSACVVGCLAGGQALLDMRTVSGWFTFWLWFTQDYQTNGNLICHWQSIEISLTVNNCSLTPFVHPRFLWNMFLYNVRKEWMAGCTDNSFSVASCSCRHLPRVHSWEVWACSHGWGRLSPVKAWASYVLERAFEQTLSDDGSLWFFQLSHHKYTKIDWMLGCSSQVQTLRFSEFSISLIFTVIMPEIKLWLGCSCCDITGLHSDVPFSFMMLFSSVGGLFF